MRHPRKNSRSGQATVELALMLPIIMMVFFLLFELSFFFASVSYVQYTAFTAARAQQVGQDSVEVSRMLMTGTLVRNGIIRPSRSGEKVTIFQKWKFDLPFLSTFGNLDYDLTVVAGPDEEGYEGRSGGNAARYADNQCRRRC